MEADLTADFFSPSQLNLIKKIKEYTGVKITDSTQSTYQCGVLLIG